MNKTMKLHAPKYIRNQKIITTEEKAEFIKRNREFLITPMEEVIPDKTIDRMVYSIKNNWKEGGAEASVMLDDMYCVLIGAGYK